MTHAGSETIRENRASSFPFLGGPISAVLLGLSFGPHASPAIPWFALLPLFLSLHRHRGSAVKRLFHGLGFGLTLSIGFLPWVFSAVRHGSAAPEAQATPIILAALFSAVAWTGIAAHHALFALAAGPILRLPGRLPALIALPVLWTGLEVARGPFFPWKVPFVANWLALGYSVPAGSPESQAAALIGVHGMSFILAATASSFLVMFREANLPRQLSFAALGCLLPLACRLHGSLALPGEEIEGKICAVVAAHEGGDVDDLARTCGQLSPLVADLVVWPPVTVSEAPEVAGDVAARSLGDILAPVRGILVASAQGSGAARLPGSPFLIIGGAGGWAGSFSPLLGFAGRGPEAGLLRSPLGTLGLAAGSQLDSPLASRKLARGGAGILAASTSCPKAWGEEAHRRLQAMHAYRALENRRWLVESSSSGAMIADPYGRSVLRLAWGIEGAEPGQVDSSEATSLYARAGWWIEPLCLLGAAALLVGALPWKRGTEGAQRQ